MEKIIKIAELISTDIRSRSKAELVKNEIRNSSGEVVLDFSDVTFVSRSFADELYSIIDSFNNREIKQINRSKIVLAMITVVKKGRENKRVRMETNSEIKAFKDLDSLSAFLATM